MVSCLYRLLMSVIACHLRFGRRHPLSGPDKRGYCNIPERSVGPNQEKTLQNPSRGVVLAWANMGHVDGLESHGQGGRSGLESEVVVVGIDEKRVGVD